jgi:hypothetical protein
MSQKPSASFVDRVVSPVGITIIVFVTILLSVGAYLYARKSPILSFLPKFSTLQRNLASAIAPTPTPTPAPISHGPINFSVSQGNKTIPQFRNGTIDPYDPQQGATQTVTIAIKHTQPVTKVTAVLKTDHAVSAPFPFTLIQGTATDGTWKGSWQVTDTYLYTYRIKLDAISASGSATNEMVLR